MFRAPSMFTTAGAARRDPEVLARVADDAERIRHGVEIDAERGAVQGEARVDGRRDTRDRADHVDRADAAVVADAVERAGGRRAEVDADQLAGDTRDRHVAQDGPGGSAVEADQPPAGSVGEYGAGMGGTRGHPERDPQQEEGKPFVHHSITPFCVEVATWQNSYT